MALPNPRLGQYDYPNHFANWEWKRSMQLAQPGVRPYIQDGVRDLGFLVLPRRADEPGILETEYHATTSTAAWTVVLAYRTLVGTLVNVTDEFGAVWRNVMVGPFVHEIRPILDPAEKFAAVVQWELWPSDPVPP